MNRVQTGGRNASLGDGYRYARTDDNRRLCIDELGPTEADDRPKVFVPRRQVTLNWLSLLGGGAHLLSGENKRQADVLIAIARSGGSFTDAQIDFAAESVEAILAAAPGRPLKPPPPAIAAPAPPVRRHSWGEPVRELHRTDRTCRHCGLVRVTRHEPPALPWTEWWRDGVQINSKNTPPCEVAQ